MNYYYGQGPGMFFGPWDVLWHVIGIVIAIWIISMILRAIFWGPRRHRRHWRNMDWHHSSALDLLDERFAKGEIEKAEYEERKKALLG